MSGKNADIANFECELRGIQLGVEIGQLSEGAERHSFMC